VANVFLERLEIRNEVLDATSPKSCKNEFGRMGLRPEKNKVRFVLLFV